MYDFLLLIMAVLRSRCGHCIFVLFLSFFLFFFLSFFLMTALCNRAGHYIFALWFLLLSSLWPPYVIGQTIFISEREREANVNSLFAVARPSVCRLSSVTFVSPTQAVQIFGNISTALGTLAID